MFEAIAALLSKVLPNDEDTLVEWCVKLALIVSFFAFITVTGYVLLQDTAIGERHGFRKLTIPQTTPYTMNRIWLSSRSNIVRLQEDRPEIKATFLFLSFDNLEQLTYLDKASIVTIDSGYSQLPFFPEEINTLWYVSAPLYLPELIKGNCIVRPIRSKQRLQDAIPGIDADSAIACPIQKKGRSIGFVAAIWKSDKSIDAENVKSSIEFYTKLIESYIVNLPNLVIRD